MVDKNASLASGQNDLVPLDRLQALERQLFPTLPSNQLGNDIRSVVLEAMRTRVLANSAQASDQHSVEANGDEKVSIQKLIDFAVDHGWINSAQEWTKLTKEASSGGWLLKRKGREIALPAWTDVPDYYDAVALYREKMIDAGVPRDDRFLENLNVMVERSQAAGLGLK